MDRFLPICLLLLSAPASSHAQALSPAPTPAPQPAQPAQPSPPVAPGTARAAVAGGIGLAFGGDLFLALQNWSRVGTSGDSKLGVGLGGDLLIGIRVDDMKVLVGPHFAYSRWSADYSNKPQSATSSVYVTMSDVGMGMRASFDDLTLQLGIGKSRIGSGMVVSGQDIPYPYDGDQYNFRQVGLGYRWSLFMVGISSISYSGYASNANRIELLFGLAM